MKLRGGVIERVANYTLLETGLKAVLSLDNISKYEETLNKLGMIVWYTTYFAELQFLLN
jgi:hypothetical protein